MTYDRVASPEDTERFTSLTAAIDAAKTRPSWGDDVGLEGGARAWCRWSSADAAKLATQGWSEGAKRASEVSTRIVDRMVQSVSGNALVETLAYDVAGGCYDIGGYLSGSPECWIRSEPQIAKRAVSICLNLAVSAGVPTSAMEIRGLAVAALVLALQAKGYPVTVDVCQTLALNYRSGRTVCSVIRVIDASTGSQLDIDRLVYAIAHPTVFRRIGRALVNNAQDSWDGSCPESEGFPPGEYDLKFGGAHLTESQRWTDGGEAWIMSEYQKQTLL